MSDFSLKIEIEKNRFFNGALSSLFTPEEVAKARHFHSSILGYEPTPLRSLDALAKVLGVGKILVKDESYRFGLNAFKVLGGSYAVAQLLCKEHNIDISEFLFAKFRNEMAGSMTFTTATDGNHGRGIAWAAQKLGQNAVIYMPKGAAKERVDNILALGAKCIVTDLNYDDAVRLSMEQAEKNGWKMVQDTAWEGYTEIPTWIMQGYSTMADEVVEQMQTMGIECPSHVVLQAGVGALAGGVTGYLTNTYGAKNINTIVIEPDQSDCLFRSARSLHGDIVNVGGDMATIMVGLACGEPNPIGWHVLRNTASHFISCSDKVAALGMRILGNPVGDDHRVISGESGAVGTGLIAALSHHEKGEALREELGLNQDSVILLFNTEGDTDPVHYREVVWEGKHPCSN